MNTCNIYKYLFSLFVHIYIHTYICIYILQYCQIQHIPKWYMTHRVLKRCRRKMGVMALWKFMHLGTWCTVIHCWLHMYDHLFYPPCLTCWDFLVHWYQQCVTAHHVSRCMSCQKATRVVGSYPTWNWINILNWKTLAWNLIWCISLNFASHSLSNKKKASEATDEGKMSKLR